MAGLVLRPAAYVCGNPSFSAAHRGETFARGMRAGDGDGIGRADTQVKGIPAWNFAFPAREKRFPEWHFAFPAQEMRFPVQDFAFPTREKRFPVRDFAFPTREKRFPVWDFAFPHGKSDFLIRKSDFLVAAHDCQATGSS